MKTKSKVKVKSKRDETVIEGQWRATARSSNAQNAARRSESARLLCKPKGKRHLAACEKRNLPLPTSGEDAASPLRNTRKRKETK